MWDILLERETGFEPATSTLARLHSTTELLPQAGKAIFMEAASRLELEVEVLQTSALPLGYAAVFFILERETGFEPATSTLARLHSTTELLPRCFGKLRLDRRPVKQEFAISKK